MNIKITSWPDAAAQHDWATDILSIHDPGIVRARLHDRHTIIHMTDAHQWSEPNGPEMVHIDRILAFGRSVSERVLVHCHVGVNRSTAAALAILLDRGAAAQAAWDELMVIRPIAYPNKLMVILLDQKFGLNGELVALNTRRWATLGK